MQQRYARLITAAKDRELNHTTYEKWKVKFNNWITIELLLLFKQNRED